jgi:hypothetical protein
MRLEGWQQGTDSRPSFETRVSATQERRRYALLRMRVSFGARFATVRNVDALRVVSLFMFSQQHLRRRHSGFQRGPWIASQELAMTRKGWRKTLNVIARSSCDEAIQALCVAPRLLRFARNDVERLAENSQRHCEKPLRNRYGYFAPSAIWMAILASSTIRRSASTCLSVNCTATAGDTGRMISTR